MSARQRGVSAKSDFRGRGEPAEGEAVVCSDEEGGLRQAILRGDGLQPLVVEPRIQ